MATSPIQTTLDTGRSVRLIPTFHVAECISECVSAIRTWREAVREVNSRFDTHRLNHERESFVHMNGFGPAVIEAAESYLSRWSR